MGVANRSGRARGRRMRVLSVLSSANQMYSGIGRAVFELSARLADRIDFEFAIDDAHPKNLDLVAAFGRRHGLPVHVGPAVRAPDCLDPLNADLPALLRPGRWDAVECVSWANAATNAAVLRDLGGALLAYTPHFQPTWTVPMSPAEAARIEAVHRAVAVRADVVYCDSPWERSTLQALSPRRDNATFLPLGCDFDEFRPGPVERRPQLLFVGDLAEPRKRFDRALDVLARVIRTRPEFRLVVVGNRSAEAGDLIPAGLRHAVELRGYVGEGPLRRAYGESRGLLLLSEFEAFGIPILEALASGTPAFIGRQEATRGIFGTFRGAHFCPADDAEATYAEVEQTLARGVDGIAEVMAERPRLRESFDWDALAERKWRALAAAWFRGACWSWSA